MLTLPKHLPVLAISPSIDSSQGELRDKLQALLEADGILVSRAGIFEPSTCGQDLVSLLTHADLVLTDSPVIKNLPQLMFNAPTPGGRGEHENAFHCQSSTDLYHCAERIKLWLEHCRSSTPLAGAVLIGGRSSRMGCPKHLIQHENGETWLERSLATLSPFVDDLVISGGGELPTALQTTERVDDLPGVQGPLAGIRALLNHYPFCSWVILACDMPNLDPRSIAWLLSQRKGRQRAVIPRNPHTGRSEPLLAWYDYRCAPLIDNMIASGKRKISELCNFELTAQPLIPEVLVVSWRNVNYPEELDSRGSSGP